jgi:polar amino acid transport system substrate-binding protein
MRRFVHLTLAACTAVSLASCAASSGGGGGSNTDCSPAGLDTHQSKTLTVATDSPAYGPWFVDDKPSNGKGFESAVAFAVAKQLGYSTSQVKWTVAAFNSVIAPGPKKFDFDVNEVSITPQRAKVVDFSSGYYDVAQSIVTLNDSKYANATSIADFHGAKLAAQKGTTSLDAINNVVKPGGSPAEFPTNDLAVEALKNGQVDGLVVDLPTGFYVTSAQVQNAKIVGQLPVATNPEQFGLVLEKGSSLTSCVSKAVDTLRTNGTLDQLQQKWLASAGNAPELK